MLKTAAVGLVFAMAFGASARAGIQQPASDPVRKVVMTRAKGTFDVKVAPLPAYDTTEATTLGRMSLDKVYHGDLDGTAKGEMLTGMTSVKNSGAYVAVERFAGTLAGRRGTFVLHHTGIMDRGSQKLTVTVVPDSGTDQLTGLSGSLNIIIAADGTHSYEFDYSLSTP
ncbi:MAG TPA: DUF3224 domain-containing protein [Vicinamibacterales bacterium]|jgi:hypothetical protein